MKLTRVVTKTNVDINTAKMKRQHQLKRQTILLLVAGTFFMSFTLLTRHFFEISLDIEDFLKGLGVAFIISSLFVQGKLERKSLNS